MKKTKHELKREMKREKAILLTAIKLQCFGCMGGMSDGYQDCEITKCPLYPYRISKGYQKNNVFMRLAKTLEKINGSRMAVGPSFWKELLEKE